MRALLLCDVRSLSGKVFRAGEVVEVVVARDGVAEVVGAGYLPLNRHEYQLLHHSAEN